MVLRLQYAKLAPEAMSGFLQTRQALEGSALGKALVELVYLRVSQINGCSYCLEKHAASLRSAGVSNAQIDTLAAWRISPHFSARERAALAWVEAVADIAGTGAPDSTYDAVRAHFDDKEVADLSFAAALMSAMNRLAISMRM